MILETFKQFQDFELLDSGEGYRLERWGLYRLARPDPQAIWQRHLPQTEWTKADAIFDGKWQIKTKIDQPWSVTWQDTKLLARLTPFKHTGIFAEQASNWEWLSEIISKSKFQISKEKPKILNLFGYTGAASVVLAKLGCFVTHVDASKPAITWAKENQAINNLPTNSIRWILDDAAKFVKREVKRGEKYDGIIADPPAFGHSPTGKTWRFGEDFPALLSDCVQLLSNDAKFILVNAYATNSSALALKNILEDATKKIAGNIDFGELCLKQKDTRLISTGIFARWIK